MVANGNDGNGVDGAVVDDDDGVEDDEDERHRDTMNAIRVIHEILSSRSIHILTCGFAVVTITDRCSA